MKNLFLFSLLVGLFACTDNSTDKDYNFKIQTCPYHTSGFFINAISVDSLRKTTYEFITTDTLKIPKGQIYSKESLTYYIENMAPPLCNVTIIDSVYKRQLPIDDSYFEEMLKNKKQ